MIKDFFIVNTFTSTNNSIDNNLVTPVAVFICQAFHSIRTMQNIAMEINTKESIFIHKDNNSNIKQNLFNAICFANNKQISTCCCGLFAASKVINLLDPKIKKITIDINNNGYNAQVKRDNNILVTLPNANLCYNNLLFNRENIVSINKYKNTLIIETKYPNIPEVSLVSLLNNTSVDTVIITSRSYEYQCDYFAQFYRNKNNIDIMYYSIIIANYWHRKINKIKLIGYFPQGKSYISTFTDSILFNIECKCIIHSNGELLVKNI